MINAPVKVLEGELVEANKTFIRKDLPKYWTPKYINEHLEALKNNQHKMLLTFLWMSGVRITEAVNLKKGDLNFQEYVMQVRWLKSRKYLYRNVPIHPRLKDILQVYVAAMKADSLVFPITRQRAWQVVKEHFGGSPHWFRHSFAVNWLRNGCDIVILHKILGHSKIQTTMEYLKIVPVDQGKELLKVKFE